MVSLCISVFEFEQLTQPFDEYYLWVKSPTLPFSQLLTANKNCCQRLATLKNLEHAANRKAYAWAPSNLIS